MLLSTRDHFYFAINVYKQFSANRICVKKFPFSDATRVHQIHTNVLFYSTLKTVAIRKKSRLTATKTFRIFLYLLHLHQKYGIHARFRSEFLTRNLCGIKYATKV